MSTLFATALQALTPRTKERSLQWFVRNIQTADGRPYDHYAYPHIGAPGGPCDALDDPRVKTIWLQWASRLGKTFFGQCAQLMHADAAPCPMMFASADQKLAVEVVSRLYRMLEKCPPLRGQMRPEHRRKQAEVALAHCRIFVAWARSVSTLADKAVRCGHANEVDKWEHPSTAKEADPLELFLDRFKEFPSHKQIIESTPQVKGRSRVESGRLQSTNCSFWAPCPHCGEYQTIRFDRIEWRKNEVGKSDVDLARNTAFYRCLNDDCPPIEDRHRAKMMRLGVWAPEGCTIKSDVAMQVAADAMKRPIFTGWKHAEWIDGTPFRDGPSAGYQLSSLCALSLGWGDIAAKFVGAKTKAQYLRNFINQWLAETWEAVDRKETWERLGEKWASTTPEGVIPDDHSLVTVGIDKQSDHYAYAVLSWGKQQSAHTVSYGTLETLAEITSMIQDGWRGADGKMIHPTLTLVDSGFRPKEVWEYVRRWSGPGKMGLCKGSNASLHGPFRVSIQGENTATPGAPLVMVDTGTTQDWIESQITAETPVKTLYEGSLLHHQDYLEQILNDAPVEKIDPQNNAKVVWERIHDDTPNDYRDAERYAFTAMLVATKCRPIGQPGNPAHRRSTSGAKFQANTIQRPGAWVQR